MQVIEPPKTTSYSTEDGHFIKTFLISTKPNEAGWQIDRSTGHDMVKTFIGKPFVIIPDHLSSPIQHGHIHADSKEELLTAYRNHEHGIIQSVSEPFSYNDGTDDYFYTANIKLNDSKAASALMEAGANAWVPFSVSPHVWGPTENGITKQWEGIGLSLVKKGAYGSQAVITKYCKGETDSCTKSLAASKLCTIEDSKAASIVTSLVNESINTPYMATVIEQPTQVKEVQQVTQPIQEEPKKDSVSLTKEEHETLLKEKEEKEQLKQQLAQLVNENKTTKLNNIFKSVKDESLKKTLTDKYFNADVNQLNDFYGDITNHVFPSLVEEAKAQAEQDLKSKTLEESKGKSKAASTQLPKEPQVDSKAASEVVPKSVNEVLRFKKMFEVGF